MFLAMALAAMDLPLSCGGRDFTASAYLFNRYARSGDARHLGELFDDKGVWRIDGRRLVGPAQASVFFEEYYRSGRIIEILGNDASGPSRIGWTATGPYVVRKLNVRRRDYVRHGIYAIDSRCKAGKWRIESLEMPRGE